MNKKKSSGVGEFAAVGALAKMSRNTKINGMGDTFILASVILLIGQLIKLPFVICYKCVVWSFKAIFYFYKYLIQFSVISIKFIYKASKYIKIKYEQYKATK